MYCDADRAAVGAPQDAPGSAHGRRLQAEHVVDEDRPVEVGLGEAVGLGLELGMRLAARRGRAGRGRRRGGRARGRRGSASARGCESSVAPAATRRATARSRRLRLGAGACRATARSVGAISPVERRGQLVARRSAASRRAPSVGPSRAPSCTSAAASSEAAKKAASSSLTEPGLLCVAGVQLLDVGGVCAVQERRWQELIVRGLRLLMS